MTPPEQTIIPEDSSKVKRWTFFRWFIRFVWAYFIFLVIILFSAFFLLLFNANPEVGIVEWIYRSADRAMEPFRGIFPTREAGEGSIVDFSIPTVERMREILDAIDRAMAADRPVYVHCFGGIGRTGTTVGCWLLRHRLAEKDDVLQVLTTLRKHDQQRGRRRSPETAEQRRFVEQWPQHDG